MTRHLISAALVAAFFVSGAWAAEPIIPPTSDNTALRKIAGELRSIRGGDTLVLTSTSGTQSVQVVGIPTVSIGGTQTVQVVGSLGGTSVVSVAGSIGGTSIVSVAGSPVFTPAFTTGGAGWTNCWEGITNQLPSTPCREIVLMNDSTNAPTMFVIRSGVRFKIGAGFGIPIKGLTNANEVGVTSETSATAVPNTNDYLPFMWYN